jgi:hypothetical protein
MLIALGGGSTVGRRVGRWRMRFTTARHGFPSRLGHGGTRSRGCGGWPWRRGGRRHGGEPWWGDGRRRTASVAGAWCRRGGGSRSGNRRWCRNAASVRGSRRRCGGWPCRGSACAAGPRRRCGGRPRWDNGRRGTASVRRPGCRSRRPRYRCFGRFVAAAAGGPRRRRRWCGGGRLTGLTRRYRRSWHCRRFRWRGLRRLGGGRSRSFCSGSARRGGLVGGTSGGLARRRRCTVVAV